MNVNNKGCASIQGMNLVHNVLMSFINEEFLQRMNMNTHPHFKLATILLYTVRNGISYGLGSWCMQAPAPSCVRDVLPLA